MTTVRACADKHIDGWRNIFGISSAIVFSNTTKVVMLCGIMDDSSQRGQLAKLIKLNEELARTNAKQASEIEALVDAAQTIREDRDRLAENQRQQRQRIEELEAINKQLTNMLWGRRSERRSFDPNQTRLFPDEPGGEEPSGITADDLAQETIDEELIKQWQRRLEQQRKKRASRRTEAFPDHFERRERVLDLDDEDKVGLKYIGDADHRADAF